MKDFNLKEFRAADEATLASMRAPAPRTLEELTSFIEAANSRPHDYGTVAHATAMVIAAAHHFMCHANGLTGFQASLADLHALKRMRHIEGPLMIIKAEDELYPQGGITRSVDEFLSSTNVQKWIHDQAILKLDSDNPLSTPCEAVLNHWVKLAGADADEPVLKERISMMRRRARINSIMATREFVEQNAEEIKAAGFHRLHGRGTPADVAFAVECRDGSMFRIEMPVCLEFEAHIQGVRFSWSINTEVENANGAARHQFDFSLLETLRDTATNKIVKSHIEDYIERAKIASVQKRQRVAKEV